VMQITLIYINQHNKDEVFKIKPIKKCF